MELKARTAGATLSGQKDTQLIGNAPAEDKQDDPETIRRQIAFFAHAVTCATIRKVRAEEVMQRRKARTWDAAKKAQMVRRLTSAGQELEQSVGALEQLREKLARLTTG